MSIFAQRKGARLPFLVLFLLGFTLDITQTFADGSGPGLIGLRLKRIEEGKPCVLVEGVKPDGPGAKAGIEAGDFILEVNGKPFDCAKLQPQTPLAPDVKAGASIVLKVSRKSMVQERIVVAEAMPADQVESMERGRKDGAAALLMDRMIKDKTVFVVTKTDNGDVLVEGPLESKDLETLRYLLNSFQFFQYFREKVQETRLEYYLADRPGGGIQVLLAGT